MVMEIHGEEIHGELWLKLFVSSVVADGLALLCAVMTMYLSSSMEMQMPKCW